MASKSRQYHRRPSASSPRLKLSLLAQCSKNKYFYALFWALTFIGYIVYSIINVGYVLRALTTRSSMTLTTTAQETNLLYSSECFFPDINPFDISIETMISPVPAITCNASFPPITYTKENVLYFDEELFIKVFDPPPNAYYSCCVQSVERGMGDAPNFSMRYDSTCVEFKDKKVINEEFIRVKCNTGNKNLYTNYHSFIPESSKQLAGSTREKFNLVILGVDSVSRLNMHRQLNSTYSYIKDVLGGIEMLGYNKVGYNTFPNLIPMLTGQSVEELKLNCWPNQTSFLDDCSFIWKDFKQDGYVTLYAEDSPLLSTFNYLKLGFFTQPTDHYFRNFILSADSDIGHTKIGNSNVCIGPDSVTKRMLDWLLNFMERYQDASYFSLSWLNNMSHDFLNQVSADDHLYYNFFSEAYEKGLLEKTILIFVSDHGMRWGPIRETYIGKLEESLPMLMLIFPRKFVEQYPDLVQNVRYNAKQLVTPYDLYHTFLSILSIGESEMKPKKMSPVGSLLFNVLPSNRTCQAAGIPEEWCVCELASAISLDNYMTDRLAQSVLNGLNDAISEVSLCAPLKLEEVKYITAKAVDKNDNYRDFTIIIVTSPGQGMFEATVRVTDNTFQLVGLISRLNLYGTQSACVSDPYLKLYCYCLDQMTTRILA